MILKFAFITERNQRSDENLESYLPKAENIEMNDDDVEIAENNGTAFVESYLREAENVEMNDNDVEIAERNGTVFKHDNLMKYSNWQLDFVQVYGEKVFVMIIGKLQIEVMRIFAHDNKRKILR